MSQSDAVKSDVVCLVTLGRPVEHLTRKLQSMDGERGSIFNICLAETNPFYRCRREISSMMSEGTKDGSILSAIFYHFSKKDDFSLEDLGRRCREMSADFVSQITFRFRIYECSQFRLLQILHPEFSDAERLSTLNDIRNKKDCCLNRYNILKAASRDLSGTCSNTI